MRKCFYCLLTLSVCFSLFACDPYDFFFGEEEIGDGPYYEPYVYIEDSQGRTLYEIYNDTVYSFWGSNAVYSIEGTMYHRKVYSIPHHNEVCSVDNDIIYRGYSKAYIIEGDSVFEFSYLERKFAYLIR